MTAPAAVRVPRSGHEGLATPASGVLALRRALSRTEMLDTFRKWADDPMTKLVLSAVRDLAVNGPLSLDVQEMAAQYGVTSGLNLAAQLMDDPSVVFPELFTGIDSSPGVLPEENYGTPVADILSTGTSEG